MSLTLKLLSALAVSSLVACGGGGSEAPSSPFSTASQTNKSSCPRATISDVWIDQRLACLSAGQDFIDMAAGAVGNGTATGDRAYVLNQSASDLNFNNILGTASDFKRYWAHFICIRNAPLIPGGGGFNIGIAADLQVAMHLTPFNSAIPNGIGSTSLGQYGGNQSGFVDTTCNASAHPIIVNYTTGKIESVNPGALGSVSQYTLP